MPGISINVVVSWAGWWLLACWPLAAHWATNPQYSYGWLVPPLAAILLVRRWRIRPAPEPSPKWATPLMISAAAIVLAAWLIAQPNPGWRLISLLLTLSAVAGSVGLSAQLGGWTWARHFAFPFFFMLTAVPWTGFAEDPLVQGLQRFVAGCTVTLLNFAGYPAVQRGGLIEIATGVLGVDEACSGVRSLQASLMASLFLGEFHRLRLGPRAILVAIGFAAAITTNIARTSFLSFSAARGGSANVSEWHDPAGYTILTACLAIIALAAELLRRRGPSPKLTDARQCPMPNPVRFGWLPGCWFLVVVLATEAWYYRPIANVTTTWTLTPPDGAKVEPLPKATLQELGCDRSLSAHWRDASNREWTVFFLEWFPHRSRSALLAQVHRPENCLPSAGLVEVGSRRKVNVNVADFALSFDAMHFRAPGGEDAFVFYCPWEIVPGKGGRNATFSNDLRSTSLRRVWHRERVLGQQVAEFIVRRAASCEEAESALRVQLASLVSPSIAPAPH